MLISKGYDLTNKEVVFVDGDRYTTDGKKWVYIPKKPYEYSPYGSVFKYSHDVSPAKNALGAKGCIDCHSNKSHFFFGKVMKIPFDKNANPVFEPQYKLIGYNGNPRQHKGIVGIFSVSFKWFTIIVLLGLFIHIILDFTARIREKNKLDREIEGEYQRFNSNFLAQHLLLVISVVLLTISGIFLWCTRYPGSYTATHISALCGGLDFWRVVHRIGGIILIIAAIYHIIYSIVCADGRKDFIEMLPKKKDFKDFGKNLMWFLGISKERPRFGRFSYFEKFDYWAVYWGCVIMIGTGVFMWFPDILKRIFPDITYKVFDVLKEIHAHEAYLAILAIFIWHIYNVHFRPGRFPGVKTWITGRLSLKEKELEHPLE